MAQRSTQRTDPSQPPDYRTYSPEVTSSLSNLPVHRSSALLGFLSHADLLIIKEKCAVVKRIFSVFYKNLQIFLAGGSPWKFPALCGNLSVLREHIQRYRQAGQARPLRTFIEPLCRGGHLAARPQRRKKGRGLSPSPLLYYILYILVCDAPVDVSGTGLAAHGAHALSAALLQRHAAGGDASALLHGQLALQRAAPLGA